MNFHVENCLRRRTWRHQSRFSDPSLASSGLSKLMFYSTILLSLQHETIGLSTIYIQRYQEKYSMLSPSYQTRRSLPLAENGLWTYLVANAYEASDGSLGLPPLYHTKNATYKVLIDGREYARKMLSYWKLVRRLRYTDATSQVQFLHCLDKCRWSLLHTVVLSNDRFLVCYLLSKNEGLSWETISDALRVQITPIKPPVMW